MQCNPAKTTIERLGGYRIVSGHLGKRDTTVIRWALPKDQGGTDGNIPRAYWEGLSGLATERGETLSITDLVVCPDFLVEGVRQ